MTVIGRMSAFYGRRRATESQHGLFLACATGAQGEYTKARLPAVIAPLGAGPYGATLERRKRLTQTHHGSMMMLDRKWRMCDGSTECNA